MAVKSVGGQVYGAGFQKIPHVVGRSGPCVVGRLWSEVRANFQIFTLTGGGNVLGEEGDCPGGGNVRWNMSNREGNVQGECPTLVTTTEGWTLSIPCLCKGLRRALIIGQSCVTWHLSLNVLRVTFRWLWRSPVRPTDLYDSANTEFAGWSSVNLNYIWHHLHITHLQCLNS